MKCAAVGEPGERASMNGKAAGAGPIIVRDLRRRDYTAIDDSYLNGYARFLGPIGTAVYLSLCRHADRNGECFPSQKRIAEQHGISDRSVRKYLDELERLNIIRVQRRRGKTGGFLSSVYFLTDKSQWRSPAELDSAGHRNQVPLPAENNGSSQRKPVPTKGTQIKGTQIKVKSSSDDFMGELQTEFLETGFPEPQIAWAVEVVKGRARTKIANGKAYFRSALRRFFENLAQEANSWLTDQARELLNTGELIDYGTLTETLKSRAAKHCVPYDCTAIGKAIECAEKYPDREARHEMTA